MPFARILLFAAIALGVLAAVFWSMNVNFAGWMGAWFSADNPTGAGLALSCVCGVMAALFYTGFASKLLPGSPALKGILYGVFLASLTIWVVPYSVSWIHTVSGQTRVVYSGDTTTVNDIKSQHPSNYEVEEKPLETKDTVRIDPVPNIGKIKPFLTGATRNRPWATVDSWRGRLLPFGLAFALFGLILGVSLSEKPNYDG
jgi:hypothetical protein